MVFCFLVSVVPRIRRQHSSPFWSVGSSGPLRHIRGRDVNLRVVGEKSEQAETVFGFRRSCRQHPDLRVEVRAIQRKGAGINGIFWNHYFPAFMRVSHKRLIDVDAYHPTLGAGGLVECHRFLCSLKCSAVSFLRFPGGVSLEMIFFFFFEMNFFFL